MLCLLLASTPVTAVVLEVEATDPLEDVVDTGTGGAVFEPSLDILSVRTDGDASTLEVIMALNGTFHEEASYTVNLLVDGEDTFTLLRSPYSGFSGSGPLGEVLNVTGRFEASLVVWRLLTPELSAATGLEIEFATASRVDGTGALLMDTLEPDTSGNAQPTVTILLPYWGRVVSGTIEARGNATDDSGVTGVVVRIDEGEWAMASGTAEWTYTIDSTTLEDGVHTLEARSYDGVLQSEVDRVVFTVANGEPVNEPPWVEHNWPGVSEAVNGVINVTGWAHDDGVVDRVEARLDGGPWELASCTDTWRFEVDTRALVEGQHRVEVVAYDDQGLVSREALFIFNVDRSAPTVNQPPILTIDSPEDGEAIPRESRTRFELDGQCEDDTSNSVDVEYRVDGGDWTSLGYKRFRWSLELDIVSFAPGSTHTFEVRGSDGVQYSEGVLVTFSAGYNTPPTLRISGASVVEGRLFVGGEATDEADGVTRIEARLEGGDWFEAWTGRMTDFRWAFNMSVETLTQGTTYRLEVRAFDGYVFSTVDSVGFTPPRTKEGTDPKPITPGPGAVAGLLAVGVASAALVARGRGRRGRP